MTTFDSILNAVLPWIIVAIGVFLMYRPLKKPLGELFGWIGGFFHKKEPDPRQIVRTIYYE